MSKPSISHILASTFRMPGDQIQTQSFFYCLLCHVQMRFKWGSNEVQMRHIPLISVFQTFTFSYFWLSPSHVLLTHFKTWDHFRILNSPIMTKSPDWTARKSSQKTLFISSFSSLPRTLSRVKRSLRVRGGRLDGTGEQWNWCQSQVDTPTTAVCPLFGNQRPCFRRNTLSLDHSSVEIL